MNRPLLTKVASFLAQASKSEDGKVNRKKAGDLAKQIQKSLKPLEVDHDQRETGSHKLNPFTPINPDPNATPIKLDADSKLIQPAIDLPAETA